MKLDFLDIRDLPGIYPGFRIDEFSPGANFITGPNASGKSSIIRALRHLLNSSHPGDPGRLNLLARFEANGTQWQVRRDGSRIEWEIDGGTAAERPSLPDGAALNTWLVTVEDLFRVQSDNERHLADQLRRELHQGFDLNVLRNGRYQVQPRIGNVEQRTRRQKLDALRKIEADHREVSADESRLPQIEEQIDQARSAQREVNILETALELVSARRSTSELETRLASFPVGMEKLLGNEAERLEELEEHAEALRTKLNDQKHHQQQAREALESSGLGDGRPGEEELELEQANITRLEEVERQLDDELETLADAEVALNNARGRLQIGDSDDPKMPELNADKLREAQELATELEDREARKRELERQIGDAGDAVDDQAIDRYQHATFALRDWLSANGSNSPDLKLPAALGCGAIIAAIAGGLSGIAWLAIVTAALIALAIIVLWLGNRSSSTENPQKRAEVQLKAQGVDAPPNWSRESVQQYLGDLDRQLAALRLAMERHNRIADIRGELQHVDKELNQLQERRRELADRIGFDPNLTTRAMAQFLGDLESFHQARLARDKAVKRLKRLQSQRAELQTEVQALLDQWLDVEHAIHERAVDLSASLRRLQELCRQAREAEAQLERAESEIKRLEDELVQAKERIQKLYHNAGLETGQSQELHERLRQLDEWREKKQNLLSLQDSVTDKCNLLADRPEILEKTQTLEAEDLQDELEQARDRAERLGDLREEKGRIENSVNRTGRDHAREKALAEVALIQDQLETIRAGVIDTQIANILLDEIESAHRKESEPPLLEAARELFSAFTHHQWELEFIENDESSFEAKDLALGERRPLSELSTATRMQLLLALRMGQIKLREQSGPSLPLIVDEALTTSDHERAGVIMRTLQQLADEQGRQILYLAAGTHEYHLWEHATGKPPKLIDLGAIRQKTGQNTGPEFRLPERQTIPEPEGMSAADYARLLKVPNIDQRQPIGKLHVFHVLHDQLELLHHLLSDWRIGTLGQFENLLKTEAGRHAITDDTVRERLLQRCRISREWINACGIGHGKPITRGVLEQADGITPSTIDRVNEKADELGHDAAALLQALQAGEVRGFRSSQIEKLEDFLRENRYLDERQRLSPDQRRAQLVQQLGGQIEVADLHQQLDWLEALSPTTSNPDKRWDQPPNAKV